jgi:catalase
MVQLLSSLRKRGNPRSKKKIAAFGPHTYGFVSENKQF